MLLSIHIPKAAGNSFREALHRRFGERMMGDYGDWAGFDVPWVNDRRHHREETMRARRDELLGQFDVIHGHFVADKYAGLFPSQEFVAFVREPHQQALAHYHFLVRNPRREHPEAKIVLENNMGLMEYLEWDAFRDHQSQFLGSLGLEDLSFVGLSGEYARSLRMFEAIFGYDLGPPLFENVNDQRSGELYEVSADVRDAVRKYRAADLELYARALERFERQGRDLAVR